MGQFLFRGMYKTSRGKSVRVMWKIEAESMSAAHDEGVARAERRKGYCGHLDSQVIEIDTDIEDKRNEIKRNALRKIGIHAANQYFHNVLGGQDRGQFGTALVLVMPQHDGRTKKGKAERKALTALGFEKSRSGAFKKYGEYPSQSVEVKEIEARAIAESMRRDGFKAFTQVFLD